MPILAWFEYATRSARQSIFRYGIYTSGPLAVSLAHFLTSILLLRSLPASEFGAFSFVLVIVHFCMGISNALLGTPFTVIANQQDFDFARSKLFFKINLLLSISAGVFCGGLSWYGLSGDTAVLFALFGALSTSRCFLRSYCFALQMPGKATVSDLVYAGLLIAGVSIASMKDLTLLNVQIALVVAVAVATLACGVECLRFQFVTCFSSQLFDYRPIWLDQSRWTLLGVAANEATSHGYAYLVVLLAGPAAFAPLAAAALFFRPVGICNQALTVLERPAMARAISAGDPSSALTTCRHFRLASITTWAVTALCAFLLLLHFPHFVLRVDYDLQTIVVAATFWAAITLLRAWKVAASALMQAAGRFADVAKLGVLSGVIVISCVTPILFIFGPAGSLFGVLIGQIFLTYRILMLSASWQRDNID